MEKKKFPEFQFIIFTDLDGTLLHHQTYSFEPALPALELIKKNNIPLLICTSKTRAEIEEVRKKLGNSHPFIPENGGAVFIPQGYFKFSFSYHKINSHYQIIELGTPYPKLREKIRQLQSVYPHQIKSFGDLSTQEVAELCNFSLSQAALAKKREYDEPFLLQDSSLEKNVQQWIESQGLYLTQGGRFYHLMGFNDKGKAASLLSNLYQKSTSNPIKTVGLGDSLNDLPLLQAVDIPFLVQKPDGTYHPTVFLQGLRLAPGKGPEGWNKAVLEIIR